MTIGAGGYHERSERRGISQRNHRIRPTAVELRVTTERALPARSVAYRGRGRRNSAERHDRMVERRDAETDCEQAPQTVRAHRGGWAANAVRGNVLLTWINARKAHFPINGML